MLFKLIRKIRNEILSYDTNSGIKSQEFQKELQIFGVSSNSTRTGLFPYAFLLPQVLLGVTNIRLRQFLHFNIPVL